MPVTQRITFPLGTAPSASRAGSGDSSKVIKTRVFPHLSHEARRPSGTNLHVPCEARVRARSSPPGPCADGTDPSVGTGSGWPGAVLDAVGLGRPDFSGAVLFSFRQGHGPLSLHFGNGGHAGSTRPVLLPRGGSPEPPPSVAAAARASHPVPVLAAVCHVSTEPGDTTLSSLTRCSSRAVWRGLVLPCFL